MRDRLFHLLGFVFPSVVLGGFCGVVSYWTVLTLSGTATQAVVVGAGNATSVLVLLHWQIDRSGDYGPSVRLQCPQTGAVIATEHTTPVETDGTVATYRCSSCSEYHSFRWGPPAPVLVSTTCRPCGRAGDES